MSGGEWCGKEMCRLCRSRRSCSSLAGSGYHSKKCQCQALGYEYSGYDGHILIKFEGNAGAIKAAAEAAVVAIHKVHTDFDQTTAVNLEKTGLDEAVYDVLVHNKNTVGDPLQIASGKRPQGTNRQAKWVGHWEQKGCYIRE